LSINPSTVVNPNVVNPTVVNPAVVNPTVYKAKTAPNTPFKTKEAYAKKEYTAPPRDGQGQPMFKMELFNPPPQPELKLPTGMNPNLQYLFAPTSAYSFGPNLQMPMQKVYNINLPGPAGGHAEMDRIYEIVLPGKDSKFTSITLGERLKIYEYVRQILININDGEDIGLDACRGHRNLMSYIKFMELNPNYYSTIHKNPYRGLPFGMLLYRSCFPIKLDQGSKRTVCAKNSIGLNIRLYALTVAEFFSHYFKQQIYKQYDVWRELIYYEYVRENIIKRKQSPNFTLLYAFFVSLNRNIDFFCLKRSTLTQKDLLTIEFKTFQKLYALESNIKSKEKLKAIFDQNLLNRTRPGKPLPDETDPNLQRYSGNILILITEAPNHNLYQWASRSYETDGIVKKMVRHGFHDDDVWLGILFQIVSAIYVMQLHCLYISNMTIEDNIYIKDLQAEGNIMGYWKYVIDGISYYIPNHGYLVMIDTNFKDIVSDTRVMDTTIQRQFKIDANNIYDSRSNKEELQKKIYQNYRNIINTNAFTKEHTQNDLSGLPPTVSIFIGKMMEDTEPDLGKIIFKYFRQFLNNRIGTYLKKDTEVPNIRDPAEAFKPGEMLAYVEATNTYKWCMYSVNSSSNPNKEKVLIKSKPDSDIEEIEVEKNNLQQYSPSEKIEQNFSGSGAKLSEDDLLETYIINSADYKS